MLIGIDASRAVKDAKTGTEHYSEQIIYHISKLNHTDNFILYAPNMPKSGVLTKLPANFSWKIIPFPRLWSQIRLSWELKFASPKPDVMFEPAHTIPIFYHPKSVITIHDLGFKYYPELYTPFERFYHNCNMDYSAKHAAQIITPSKFTKQDILKFYPKIKSSDVTVIYHGYNKELYNTKPAKLPTNNHGVTASDKYLFFVGRIEEKKNLQNAIKAYGILRQNKQISHKFVLAGKPGYNYEQIKAEINKLPTEIKTDVVELGYVSDQDLTSWIKNADIYFFPSNFEGFGLPIIEAMASGIPVATSNVTSMPEIAGQAAVLFNQKDPHQMAEKIEKLILDKHYYSQLKQAGLSRASEFTWESAAQQTLKTLINTAKNNKKN